MADHPHASHLWLLANSTLGHGDLISMTTWQAGLCLFVCVFEVYAYVLGAILNLLLE